MEETAAKTKSEFASSPERFKKPVLIGRIGKLPKKATKEPEKAAENPKEETPAVEVNTKPTPEIVNKEVPSAPVAYKEPKWSGLCPDGSDYGLEVLKSGMIVENVNLTQQPYFVFGRLPNCDVVMAHPTVSRHHCILQYKAFAEVGEPASGWYLYDLGSTHGTFLNKERVKPAHYTRVRVGHQIKFGNSTRTYILTGPDFDCEGESELTVTEIKQKAQEMKLERDRMIREAVEQREKDKIEAEKKREEQGIDWGMGEDAEDETDLSENPFAVTTNEELYLTDPKKTLRGYFEREGHELTYDCEERGQGQYLCKVELPIDDARGRSVIAEAIHTGKKKEAVVACALEACRILDRAGLLRQAKHESRRRKERDWSADDYYDSDDDNYLDRTGQVERKRKVRMQRSGVLPEQSGVLTYDDLVKQISSLESQITVEERTLERLRSNARVARAESDADDLDQFMATLAAPTMSVKAEISTSKMTLQKLKSELSKTQRLADLARPAHLPPLVKKEDGKLVKLNSVVYGKRIKLKSDVEKKPTLRKVLKQEHAEFVEEVDSDEEESRRIQKDTEAGSSKEESKSTSKERKSIEIHEGRKKNESEEIKVITETDNEKGNNEPQSLDNDKHNQNVIKSENKSKNSGAKNCKSDDKSGKSEIESEKSENESEKSESKKVYGPMRPPDNYVIPESYFDQESTRDLPEIMEEE